VRGNHPPVPTKFQKFQNHTNLTAPKKKKIDFSTLHVHTSVNRDKSPKEEKMKNEKPQKQETPKGVKILTRGQYYYKTETAKGIKKFEMTVRAKSLEMFREESVKYIGTDDNGKSMFRKNSYLNIRGQLKKRLLPILLRRDHPDFARVRFVTIDEIISEDGKKLDLPVNLRSRAQLVAMIAEEQIPIDPNEYLELDDLRSDIIGYLEAPEEFLKSKPLKDRRRQEERDFITMNNLGDETLPPVREPRKEIPRPTPSVGGGILDD